jgi:hypothetical protein
MEIANAGAGSGKNVGSSEENERQILGDDSLGAIV